ncbi:15593_t:CDS:2, partial [Racocetra fulgida]
RGGHEAVLLKNTIYFMGGSRAIPNASPFISSIRGYNLSNEIFYLDLTSPFSTASPPYVDLSGTAARLRYGNEKGTALVGGPSNDEILLVGGVQQNLTLLDQIDRNSTITSNQTLMINEFFKTWDSTNQTIFIYRPTARIWMNPESAARIGAPTIRRSNVPTPRSHSAAVLLPD